VPKLSASSGECGFKEGITLHDLANDVALTIENAQDGQAIIVGHAFGNWVARMTAVDHPELVRGVVIAAAASKDHPKDLLVSQVTLRFCARRRASLTSRYKRSVGKYGASKRSTM
jgi:pimeloyl-ACP methyl ester carboxylesterase